MTSTWLVTFLLIYVGVNGVHVMEYMHTLRVRNVQLDPIVDQFGLGLHPPPCHEVAMK